jgi:hypothetical protein
MMAAMARSKVDVMDCPSVFVDVVRKRFPSESTNENCKKKPSRSQIKLFIFN